jgi:Ca2+-transporting ATPase
MRTIKEILSTLVSSPETGLTEINVAQSRQKFGANHLTPIPREPIWKKFLEKFDEPIIKILLGAALLSIVVDLFKASTGQGALAFVVAVGFLATAFAIPKLRMWVPSMMFGLAIVLAAFSFAVGHPSYEGLAVMVAVVLATGVAFISEYRSDREFEVLNARKESIQVKVTRQGAFHTIPLDEVVVGDLVMLETGDEVPADGRLLKAVELYIDQSLMTGENEPVRKQPRPIDDVAEGPDQPGCLFRGTQVADGTGLLIVTEVGDETMLGQIARRLSADDGDEEEEAGETADKTEGRIKKKLTISKSLTPLQVKLQALAELISKVGYYAAGAIFLALMVRGVIRGNIGPSAPLLDNVRELIDAVVYTVIIIVVAVPEGLPMSVTVSLALAMRRMTRANSLVRQLVACETVGSATVICSDKTGTLTQNKMQLDRLWWDGQNKDRGTASWPILDKSAPWPRNGDPINWIALISAVNSTAHLEQREVGKWVPVGNSTEGALLLWLHESGIEYQNLRLQFAPLYQIHFSSERKRMTTVIQYGSRLAALVKGAPEWIMQASTHYVAADGTIKPWTPDARAALDAALHETAGRAMRTLAFGFSLLPEDTPVDEDTLHARRDELESGLVFAGFVAIRDPLRLDVKDAVDECRAAGIEVKMITGDNVDTARAIAHEIGLLDRPDAVVLTSNEFNEKTDDELREIMPKLRVLARARPLDKLRMVNLLQSQHHVVAMTGDGTNDAPALKRADVGLAMGIAGTEVAKEASKIVLLDDAFSTIVRAVHWGRSLYENIQRFIQFQLTINVSALVIAFLGPFFGVRPPFTVLQLLWINVIMDTFASIALCSEPPREGLMKLPPKRKDENILTPSMIGTIFSTAAFFVIVMLGMLLGMEYAGWFSSGSGDNPEGWDFLPLNIRQVTIFFTTYVLFQVWNQINSRTLTPEVSGLSGVFKNPMFLTIASLIVFGQLVIVNFGGTVFKVEPLRVIDWLVIAAGTTSVLGFAEIVRRIRKARMPAAA